MVMIHEEVIKLLNGKEWTFNDIRNIEAVVTDMSNEIFGILSLEDKVQLIYTLKLPALHEEINTFDRLFHKMVMYQIQAVVADILKEELNNAKINFNNKNEEDDINEIPKGSLGGESLKGRSTDEKSNSKK
mgnify:CR=1 FL=1